MMFHFKTFVGMQTFSRPAECRSSAEVWRRHHDEPEGPGSNVNW